MGSPNHSPIDRPKVSPVQQPYPFWVSLISPPPIKIFSKYGRRHGSVTSILYKFLQVRVSTWVPLSHSPRDGPKVSLVKQHYPHWVSLRPLEIFISTGINMSPSSLPLISFSKYGRQQRFSHWVSLLPLEIFLNIGIDMDPFPLPIRNFLKYIRRYGPVLSAFQKYF